MGGQLAVPRPVSPLQAGGGAELERACSQSEELGVPPGPAGWVRKTVSSFFPPGSGSYPGRRCSPVGCRDVAIRLSLRQAWRQAGVSRYESPAGGGKEDESCSLPRERSREEGNLRAGTKAGVGSLGWALS